MEEKPIPLTMVKPGKEVTVIAIHGGRGIKARLASLGLIPGVKVKVLGIGPGPLIVAVKDTRLALGYGMAQKILVNL